MIEQLVSFDTAKLARQKRFNIGYESYNNIGQLNAFGMAGGYYDYSDKSFEGNTWAAPTQSLLQKWLREVHKIHIVIGLDENGYALTLEEDCDDLEDREVTKFKYYSVYNTYELALEAGLIEGLKLIK